MSAPTMLRRFLILFATVPFHLTQFWLCAAVLHISPFWCLAWDVPISVAWTAFWTARWARADRDRDLRVLRARVEDYLRGVR